MELHERIRAFLEPRVSAQGIAELLGCSAGAVRNWLRGDRGWDVEDLARVLDHLQVAPADRGELLSLRGEVQSWASSSPGCLVPGDEAGYPAAADMPQRPITVDNEPTEEVPLGPLHLDGRHLGRGPA
mgnify:CR=1 FL=1